MKFIIKLPAYLIYLLMNFFNLQEGKLEAEAFTEQLYDTLKSTPQPCLVPFLKVLRSKACCFLISFLPLSLQMSVIDLKIKTFFAFV